MSFRAAFGKLDFTPPLEMQGSFRLSHDGHAAGVHDPVYARWMVAEDGSIRWCLVALDVVMLQREQAAHWRERIGELSGVDLNRVTISCTHTHSGPDLPNEWGRHDKAWETDLIDRIGKGIAEAANRLEPATCGWAQTQYDGPINRHEVRRVKLREGDEAAARAEAEHLGPVDRALTVLRVDATSGRPLGHLVHFNAHPTTAMGVDQLLSADYPGVLLAQTETRIGGVGVFLQGTCGNVNLEIGERAFRHAERHGRAMGELAARALEAAPLVGLEPVPSRVVEWDSPYHAGLLRIFRELEERKGSDLLPDLVRAVREQYVAQREVPHDEMIATFAKVTGRDLAGWFAEKWGIGR